MSNRNRSGRLLREAGLPLGCCLLLFCTSSSLDAQEFHYLRTLLGARPAPAVEVEQLARESIVELAREQLGTPYRWGSSSPDRGFDCSGLVLYVMNQLGISLPRTAALQARIGQPIERDRRLLRPGDLLTFGRGARITHIGIYIGDGRYIHASSRGRRVVESELPGSGWWRGVRRLELVRTAAASMEGGD